jgi:hypothetical protein
MDHFGLVDVLRDYCEEKEYIFIYGSDAYANIQMDINNNEAGKIILVGDFTCAPTYTGGIITELRYTGLLLIGQKREYESESSLDESPIQKFDRRLKALSTLLTTILSDLACENELEVTNVTLRYDLNKFDLNADFVACSLTLVQ